MGPGDCLDKPSFINGSYAKIFPMKIYSTSGIDDTTTAGLIIDMTLHTNK